MAKIMYRVVWRESHVLDVEAHTPDEAEDIALALGGTLDTFIQAERGTVTPLVSKEENDG